MGHLQHLQRGPSAAKRTRTNAKSRPVSFGLTWLAAKRLLPPLPNLPAHPSQSSPQIAFTLDHLLLQPPRPPSSIIIHSFIHSSNASNASTRSQIKRPCTDTDYVLEKSPHHDVISRELMFRVSPPSLYTIHHHIAGITNRKRCPITKVEMAICYSRACQFNLHYHAFLRCPCSKSPARTDNTAHKCSTHRAPSPVWPSYHTLQKNMPIRKDDKKKTIIINAQERSE